MRTETFNSNISIFLSYARGDDEIFVKRLRDDLIKTGIDVWFDQVSLPSRKLTFHQEIKSAIQERQKMVYISGRMATISDYVREEWKFALECDKTVIPILRLGSQDDVPGELSLFQSIDFRDDLQYEEKLANLIENIKMPEPFLLAPFAVPSLPPHFVGRPKLLSQLKEALLVDLKNPIVITGYDSCVGLTGMGGIGKSAMASAVVLDSEVRRSYPDGVMWITFGKQPDVTQLMRDVAVHLKDSSRIENIVQGKGILKNLLLNKSVMFVFDNVWSAADVAAFDILGPRCRALITTRDSGILETLQAKIFEVELFTEIEALLLLANFAGISVEKLPFEARKIIRECGYLPLAVALCGGLARKRDGVWPHILERLRRADLEKIGFRENEVINPDHKNIWRAMQVSVEELTDDEQQRFSELSVFVTDQTTPEAAVAVLWVHTGNLNNYDTQDLLYNFAERSLVRLHKEKNNSKDGKINLSVSLHDLLYDFASRVAVDSEELHNSLVEAYAKKCAEGWATGPNDGYFYQQLPWHILKAGQTDEIASLARDGRFLLAQDRAVPDNPSLSLHTILAALDEAISTDNALDMAEFTLAHANRVSLLGTESPLQALRLGSLVRALSIADQYPPALRLLWHLLLFSDLADTGRHGDAHQVWKKLREFPSIRLEKWWHAQFAAFCMAKATLYEPFTYWLQWAVKTFDRIPYPLAMAFSQGLSGTPRFEDALIVAELEEQVWVRADAIVKIVLKTTGTENDYDIYNRALKAAELIEIKECKELINFAIGLVFLKADGSLNEQLRTRIINSFPIEITDVNDVNISYIMNVANFINAPELVERVLKSVQKYADRVRLSSVLVIIAPQIIELCTGTNNLKRALSLIDGCFTEDKIAALAAIALSIAKTNGDPRQVIRDAIREAENTSYELEAAEGLVVLAPVAALTKAEDPQAILQRTLQIRLVQTNEIWTLSAKAHALGHLASAVVLSRFGELNDNIAKALELAEYVAGVYYEKDGILSCIARSIAEVKADEPQLAVQMATDIYDRIGSDSWSKKEYIDQIALGLVSHTVPDFDANISCAMSLVKELEINKQVGVLVKAARTVSHTFSSEPQKILSQALDIIESAPKQDGFQCKEVVYSLELIGGALYKTGGDPALNAAKALAIVEQISYEGDESDKEHCKSNAKIALSRAVVEAEGSIELMLQQRFGEIDCDLSVLYKLGDGSMAVNFIDDIACGVVQVEGDLQVLMQPVVEYAYQLPDQESRSKSLMRIATAVVKSGQAPDWILNPALDEVKRFSKEEDVSESLGNLACALARSGFTERAIAVSCQIMDEIERYLTDLVTTFGETMNIQGVRALVKPSAMYPESSLAVCAALAMIFPQQAYEISELVMSWLDNAASKYPKERIG